MQKGSLLACSDCKLRASVLEASGAAALPVAIHVEQQCPVAANTASMKLASAALASSSVSSSSVESTLSSSCVGQERKLNETGLRQACIANLNWCCAVTCSKHAWEAASDANDANALASVKAYAISSV